MNFIIAFICWFLLTIFIGCVCGSGIAIAFISLAGLLLIRDE